MILSTERIEEIMSSFGFDIYGLCESHEQMRKVGLRIADSLKKCGEENAQLKAALFEVTGNYAIQGKKLQFAIERLKDIASDNSEIFGSPVTQARECLEKIK